MGLNYQSTAYTAVPSYAPTTAMSLCAWCRHPGALDTGGIQRIYDHGSSRVALLPTGGVDEYCFQRTWDSGLVEWTWELIPTGIDKGLWHFVGVTYDGSAATNNPTVYMAQEGDTSLATATLSDPVDPTGSVVNTAGTAAVGNRVDGLRPFVGDIAWLTVYDAVLSAGDVLDVFNNGSIASNLYRGYELVSTSGAGGENDLSANNADATGTNSPTFVTGPRLGPYAPPDLQVIQSTQRW